MALLVAIIVVAILLAGFLWLTRNEAKRGVRVLEPVRRALDAKTEKLEEHVRKLGSGAPLGKALQTGTDHLAHEVAHSVLQGVRFLERALTRAVRDIRGRRARVLEQENGGEPPQAD